MNREYANETIVNSPILNKFSIEQLDCFYRPRAIISNCLVKNSLLLYLLFSELQSGFYESKYYRFLFNMTGVSFRLNYEKKSQFRKKIISLLQRGTCVITVSDLFYEEQQPQYKKYGLHHWHFTIVKGYIQATDEFTVIDEEYGGEEKGTGFEDKEKALFVEKRIRASKLEMLCCSDEVSNFSKKKHMDCFFFYVAKKTKEVYEISDLDLRCEYLRLLNIMIRESDRYARFLVKKVQQYQSNLKRYKNKPFVPYPNPVTDFMIHYNFILTQKKIWSMIDLGEKRGILGKLFFPVTSSGKKIKGLLIKSLYTQKPATCDPVVKLYLHEMLQYEKKLYLYMCDIIQGISFVHIFENGPDTDVYKEITPFKDSHAPNKPVFVCLRKYMDNRGIALSKGSTVADLTGGGMSYYFNTAVDSKFFSFVNAKSEDEFDNMRCKGQTIGVPEANYRNLLVAGCAEWGSYEEKVSFIYKGSKVELKDICFTDWIDPPRYGEECVLEGRVLESSGEEKKLTYRARIFMQSISINENECLLKIKLPQNVNIHIFAMSLCLAGKEKDERFNGSHYIY